jgi:hypothetical protein
MTRNVPNKYKEIYNRAMAGNSRKAACRIFCLECVQYIPKEVKLCTDKGCPLYPYRPKVKEDGELVEEVAENETTGD